MSESALLIGIAIVLAPVAVLAFREVEAAVIFGIFSILMVVLLLVLYSDMNTPSTVSYQELVRCCFDCPVNLE